MPAHELPGGEENAANDNHLKNWYTKEQAMEFLRVGRSTFDAYRNTYGLKCSQVGGIVRVHIDDINDFLMRYRK